jgi:hypothetical protein
MSQANREALDDNRFGFAVDIRRQETREKQKR